MLLAPLCQGEMPLPSRGWEGKDIASRECAIGKECPASTKQWRDLARSQATSAATFTSSISKSRIVGCSCALGRDRRLDEWGGHTPCLIPALH
jgi:hypothetical protein